MTTDSLTDRLRISAPEALDLVEATTAEEHLARVELELAALEREAAELCAAADAAEAEAAESGLDPSVTVWTIARLQRFLEDLRAEAERDARTMIEVARHQARLLAEDRRSVASFAAPSALRLVPESTVPPSSAPVVPIDPVRATPARPLADPVVVPVGAPVLPDTRDEADAPAPEPTPVVVAEPAPVVVAEPAPVVVAEPAPVVDPVVTDDDGAPARVRRSFPVAAILEIVAVLLLLAFILFRLS